MHLARKDEDRKKFMHISFLAFALLQANPLCAALVLLPPIPPRDATASTPFQCARRPSPTWRCCLTAPARNDRRRYRALLPEALPSHRSTRAFGTPRSRVMTIPRPLFGTAETATGGHAADGSRAPGMPAIISGGGRDDDETRDPLDKYDLEAETQQLLSMPTIDIKLELQMRGVEHRDLFEKIELAKRLAESRASSSCSAGASAPPSSASGRVRDRADGDRTSSVSGNGGEGSWRLPWGEEKGGSASPSSAADVNVKEEPDDLYARDVSRAIRMGKQAVTRELNAMGIAHSRLSSLTLLARQYAIERRKARTEAGENIRYFKESSGAEGAGKNSRGQRGKGPSWEMWARGARGAGVGNSPQALRRHEEGDLDEEEGESEVMIQSSEGRARVSLGGYFTEASDMWTGQQVAGGGTDCSAGGQEGGEKSHGADVEVSGGRGGAAGSRRREASLRARADSMSSREIMSALDALGARYRIPAPRSELQAAFVSAVVERRHGIGAAADAGDVRSATLDDRRNSSDIVPLDSYSEEEDGVKRERRQVCFDSYDSALSWVRQLTFDDILEELRFRGLRHDPRAGFGSLSRTLAEEVVAEEQLLADLDSKVTYESELENAMAMSAQGIIRTLREGGEQADVTSSQKELAEKLVAMRLRDRGAPLVGTDGSRREGQSDAYEERGNPYRQRAREGRQRGGRSDDSGYSVRKARSRSSDPGTGIGGWVRLGDDGYDRGEDDTVVDLEEVGRSVGGAVWRTAREAGSLFTDTASGIFTAAFAGDEAVGAPGTARAAADRGQRREVGVEAPRSGITEKARAARERGEGARQAAASFAQSSVNRAGLTVASSAANGFLRGAEAAADWAGGGALAREYVLLIVASFCLVFKRGIGASIALLFLIRTGRIAVQKFMTEGRVGERSRRAARGGQQVAATASASSSPSRAVGSSPPAAPGRGGTAFEKEARRRSRQSQTNKKQRARRKTTAGSSRAERSKAKTRANDSRRGRPLWEESDDGSDGGCVVM